MAEAASGMSLDRVSGLKIKAPGPKQDTPEVLGGNLPKIALGPVGDDGGYWSWYNLADFLESYWPGQDAHDFVSAVEYNDSGPWSAHAIVNFSMKTQGHRCEDSWVWMVAFEDGSVWRAEGSCDYTGWDCRSALHWTLVLHWTPVRG